MTTRKKLQTAVQLLEEVMDSEYWPMVTPCPCSTEVAIRKAVTFATSHLHNAIFLHDRLYPSLLIDTDSAPCTKVERIN